MFSDTGRKAMILIVDDQEIIRKTVIEALGVDNYDFLEAEDGQRAVQLFLEKGPDIIMLDAVMPKMNGFEACRFMREAEKEASAPTPILMITSLSDVDSVNEGFAAGVNDFIQKPINIDILRRRLELMIKQQDYDEKLRKSEERFRMMAENALDCIVMVRLNPFRYEYISPVIERITGYNVDEFYHDPRLLSKIIYHRDREKLKLMINEGISEHQLYDIRIMHKNGQLVFVESQVVPVITNKTVIGLQIISRDISQRKKDEMRRRLESTKKALFETVKALSSTIEIRDPYTSGHQNRVAELAVAIAKEMDLDNPRIDAVQTAALLHDIGKITIPAEYLSKPGDLSDLEFSIIKHHPVVGYEILQPIEFHRPIAQIVYQHHERIDGSGYPLGLAGDEILLEARIIGVADVVEAMSSHRPYRAALGLDIALQEISSHLGDRYDADVGTACLRVFEKGDFMFSSAPFRKQTDGGKR